MLYVDIFFCIGLSLKSYTQIKFSISKPNKVVKNSFVILRNKTLPNPNQIYLQSYCQQPKNYLTICKLCFTKIKFLSCNFTDQQKDKYGQSQNKSRMNLLMALKNVSIVI